MANSNGRISAPVGIDADIAPVLGVGSYDLGYLCHNDHGKINKWAKFKPVIYPQLDDTGEWWRASDGMCGLNITVYTGIGTLSSGFLKDLMAGVDWPYRPPYGGDAAPYRALDFNGYFHYAIRPFGADIPGDVYVDSNGRFMIQLENTTTDSANLKLSDIRVSGTSLSEYYGGLVLVKGSSYIIGTAPSKMNGDTLSITFGNMSARAGTYKVGMFLCSSRIDVDGSIPAAKYIALPVQPKNMVVHAAGTLYSVAAFGYWNGSRITYNYIVTNNNSAQLTISGIKVMLYRSKTTPEAGEIVSTFIQGVSHTVAAKSEFTSQEYTSQAISRDSSYTYYMAASATGAATTYTPVEDVAPEEDVVPEE